MISRQSGHLVSVSAGNQVVRFFVTNPDDEIQKYHFEGDFYEKEELEIIRTYCPPDAVFVDIGANIGNHAIFAEKFLGAREVILFEPNPAAIAHLEINLMLNNCQKMNRDYLGFPLSDEMGQSMTITLSPSNNIGNTVFAQGPGGGFRTITGDFALAHRPVGFIKIDVEEMEFQVLDGLTKTVAIWKPNMFVEVLERHESELQSWVEAHGYRIAESQKRYLAVRNYVLVPA